MKERYDTKQEIQLMRLADYFGAAFSKVSTSKFPWIKILKASSVAKMADVSFLFVFSPIFPCFEWIEYFNIYI